MIDIDQLERIVRGGDRYGHNTPGVALELIAEIRRLRNVLASPQHMNCQIDSGGWWAHGIDRMAAEEAFLRSANAVVTVYYGEKQVFTNMAAFLAAHPEAA
ncbi:hypothetical protein [Burkholderia multivorans]|uniref:hypothetical protein n=1 Tax=Burkholderia multivorans TaxID=87883 RepID=UPI0021C11D91|nr:hypothetical protein [Burkholderia multivorans]MDR9052086.1 hypothetical protein [Burkholderia multivorans]MDR9060158.1 hypothetical protein [Burkholderia multivorans]MDR9062463.1 hypothetical protein [Burkholderia multivorans]MDR9072189.1 hypothetical protein [Burkholderia multivorans]MDR9076514.1 hypothetical protein [Burkholderia multivorans]